MTFVSVAGLNVDLSAFSPSNQELIRLVADLENMQQAEAAVSPAPPQPASTAVPTDASGVGKPEASETPVAANPQPNPTVSRAEAEAYLREQYSIVAGISMSAAALEELEQCSSLFGHQKAKDRGTAQADLLADMSEDNNDVGLFLREHLSWSEKHGAYVNRFVNINGGEANNGKADNGKTHTDRFSKPANLRVLSYYMTDGQTGCLTVSVRGHSFDITVPKGCAIVCSQELLEQCKHSHGARGRCVSIVTEVKGDRLPPDATEDERREAAAAQEELPLYELFPTWLPHELFFGDKLRNFGGGGSGGSIYKLALTKLAGGKEKGARRKMKVAREQLAEMMEDEIKKLASDRTREIGNMVVREDVVEARDARVSQGGHVLTREESRQTGLPLAGPAAKGAMDSARLNQKRAGEGGFAQENALGNRGGTGGANFKPENTACYFKVACAGCGGEHETAAQIVPGPTQKYRVSFKKRKHDDGCVNSKTKLESSIAMPSRGVTTYVCHDQLCITLA